MSGHRGASVDQTREAVRMGRAVLLALSGDDRSQAIIEARGELWHACERAERLLATGDNVPVQRLRDIFELIQALNVEMRKPTPAPAPWWRRLLARCS